MGLVIVVIFSPVEVVPALTIIFLTGIMHLLNLIFLGVTQVAVPGI